MKVRKRKLQQMLFLVLTCCVFVLRPVAADQNDMNEAKAAFEQFKQMEGKWFGKSTKGWEEEITYKTIAGGSVVVGTSFDAHPNETMMTMYHMDQGRLLLTHYCIAQNQPRLEAKRFEENGKKITFEFLDGTNLSSRDQGHMDKLVIRFMDPDHVVSQWTWYQNGNEKWLEEIHLERMN